jgi:hypothetical protein
MYFVAICYILWLFGKFSPFLVFCTKKNLATLRKGVAEASLFMIVAGSINFKRIISRPSGEAKL